MPAEFDGQPSRRVYDEGTETWWFSVIDVVQVLTDSENTRDYWFKIETAGQIRGRGLNCRQFVDS